MAGPLGVYQDSAGQFRFRLRAPNNETIATSEGYTSLAGCKNGIEAVRAYAPEAELIDRRASDSNG